MTTAECISVEQLISQIDKATEATAELIKACTNEKWQMIVSDEERSVGVVCHHIAYAYPFVVDWALKLARREGVPAVTYDDVHALNHQHAEAQAGVDPDAALALLATNAAAARDQLGQLSDSDLQTAAPFPLIGGQPISVQQMVQWFLINHAHNHLEAIHNSIGGNPS